MSKDVYVDNVSSHHAAMRSKPAATTSNLLEQINGASAGDPSSGHLVQLKPYNVGVSWLYCSTPSRTESNMSGLLEADRVAIVEWAERHPEIKRVYLYGSRARGDHHSGSDIDLAIEVIAQPGDANSFATWMYWHSAHKEAPDLHLSAEPHPLWVGWEEVEQGVEKDGVLLFERS